MTWREVIGHFTGNPWHEPKAMTPDEDEEEFEVIPIGIPEEAPQKPIEVPQEEPVKVPQKVSRDEDEESLNIPKHEDEGPRRRITGELVGYRHFEAGRYDGQWKFASPQQHTVWERGVQTAHCTAPGSTHFSPAPSRGDGACNCGIHSCHTEDSPSLQQYGGNEEWTAQVASWGKCRTGTVHPDVIRAEHSYITGIRPPTCEQCPQAASHLISARSEAPSGRPTCIDHKPDTIEGGVGIITTPIEEVAKHLAKYYGGATIKMRGESWTDDDFGAFEKSFKESSWSRVGWSYPKVSASPFGKEFKKVRDALIGEGWTPKETAKGTTFLAPADKIQDGYSGIVTTHNSPSDRRAFKNFLGDLKNHGGFIWPPEKARQRQEKQEKQITLQHDPETCLQSKGFDTKGLTPVDIEEFDQMAHAEEDERGVA